MLAELRENRLVRLGHSLRKLGRHVLALLLQPDLLERCLERLLHRATLLLRERGHHLLEPGLELLPDPRYREEPARPHLGEVLDDLPRVRAARDREATEHRQIVADVAL